MEKYECEKCGKETETIFETSDEKFLCQSCYEDRMDWIDRWSDDAYDRWKDDQMDKAEEAKLLEVNRNHHEQFSKEFNNFIDKL